MARARQAAPTHHSKVSRASVPPQSVGPQHEQLPGFEGHYGQAGEYTIGFECDEMGVPHRPAASPGTAVARILVLSSPGRPPTSRASSGWAMGAPA